MTITPEFHVSRILVAVDGSERAGHVLDAAVVLAAQHGATLTVLRVVGVPVELPHDALDITPDVLAQHLHDDALARTRTLLESRGVAVVPRIETGATVPTILRVASELDVSLIVIGAHGYRFAERVFGTTVSRVVDRATQSVFVVR